METGKGRVTVYVAVYSPGMAGVNKNMFHSFCDSTKTCHVQIPEGYRSEECSK